MGHVSHYKEGQHLFICDICGFVHHSEKKRIMWNGLIVDPKCFEIRHPQDFVRGIKDEQAVKDSRPESGNAFLSKGDVTSTDFTPNITPAAKATITFLSPGDVTADDL